ncbi:MAG: hypothetical protein WD049_03185, partial [Candidatus Paceibacterota bacterium]
YQRRPLRGEDADAACRTKKTTEKSLTVEVSSPGQRPLEGGIAVVIRHRHVLRACEGAVIHCQLLDCPH